jgi:hypothetical protein
LAQQAPGADAVSASCLLLRLPPRGSGAALGLMGIFILFVFWMILGTGVALLLRAVIRSFTEGWHPVGFIGSIVLALLQAFPFVFAFTPYPLMKRGLGVLIPASFYLCGATYERLFGDRTPDAEDSRNLMQAAGLFFTIWVMLAFILFLRRGLADARRSENERQA